MNKHLSVLALYARNNFLRLLSLMAAMGILEAVLYVLHWNRVDREQPPLPAAEDLLRGIPLMSTAALLLLLFLLCRSDDEAPAIAYTLRRLRIPEETTVLWKAVYNGLCLLLFWAVQAGAAMGLCLWYASVIGPDYSSPQTVFLAFYRSPFFHNLLPLDNWTRYLRNLVLLLSLGFCAAVRTYKLRRGSRYGWGMVTFLWGVVYASFSAGISSCFMDIVVIAVSLIAAAADAAYLRRGWRGSWMKRIRIDWDRLAPVGLGGRLTVRRICVGLLLVDLYEWIAFTNKFSHYQRMLYQYIPNGGKELLPGAVMAPFYQTLSNNSWGAGLSLLMIPLALWHYFYHYQDSRSIYLMRRLPDRRELWRRCLTIPLLGLAACILLYGGNLFIFYAIYESFIPPQCLQPGQWRMLWEYMFH